MTTPGSVQVQILDGGSFRATYDKLHAHQPADPFRMYIWAFHIYHPQLKKHVIWDVGVSSNKEEYTAFTVKHVLDALQPLSPRFSLPEQLENQGIPRNDVKTVIFSHHHWDHSRPIKIMFPEATGYFGPGTFKHCSPGRFHSDDYHPDGRWDAHFFHPENRTENCAELDGDWVPFALFDKALDFFGDGSFWIIQAPGHMVGNLVAAAKLPSGAWVILGGDCCHSRELFDGKYDFAKWESPDGTQESLHENLSDAHDTVTKLREMEKKSYFHIALAHDAKWMLEGQDPILMSLLNDQMKDFVRLRLPSEGHP